MLMRRLFIQTSLLLLCTTTLLTGVAIVMGKLLPTGQMFTATTATINIAGYPEPHGSVILIDSNHRLELPVSIETPADSFFPDILPDGYHIMNMWREEIDGLSWITHIDIYDILSGEGDTILTYNREVDNPSITFTSDLSAIQFVEDNTLYIYHFETMQRETVLTSTRTIRTALPIPNRTDALIRYDNGDFYRINLNNPDEEVLLIENAELPIAVNDPHYTQLAVQQEENIIIVDVMNSDIIQTIPIPNAEILDRLIWSPDGNWLAIATDPEANEDTLRTNAQRLYTVELATGVIYSLNDIVSVDDNETLRALWSSDSTQLAIEIIRGASQPLILQYSDIYVLSPMGENMHQISEGARRYNLRWMSDRPILLFLKPVPNTNFNQLYMVDTSAEVLNPVMIDPAGEMIQYADENTIVYIRRDINESRLYALNIETGEGRYLSTPHHSIYQFTHWEN